MSSEPAVTRILAIRHGETVWNAELRMQGQLDTALSARGRWQAQRLVPALIDEGIEAIWSSDLQRAVDTATPLAEALGLPIERDAGLRERHFGIWQGSTYAEIEARWPEEAKRWRQHDPDFGPRGGEVLSNFSKRAVLALTSVAAAHGGRTLAVVTHGGVLDNLHRAALGLQFASPRSWELANAAIHRLLFADGKFTIIAWGDVSHLDGATVDDGIQSETIRDATRPSRSAP